MCGRAEYGGGLGTAQSDAWNVIVGLTKNARTPDKDVVTIEILVLSRLPIPLSPRFATRFDQDARRSFTRRTCS